MKRTFISAALWLALTAGPGWTEPEFRLSYPGGVPRVEISGDWSQSHYTVWRGDAATGPFQLISESSVLCWGPCYAEDFDVTPGGMYFYRFDVESAAEPSRSFGPYAAVISSDFHRLSAALTPNPGRGATRLTLFSAARTAMFTDASLFDLQGRRVATLFQGELPAGHTQVSWSGRGRDGREVGGGIYLLRVTAADGRAFVAKMVRSR
jgi:hypothetical protein